MKTIHRSRKKKTDVSCEKNPLTKPYKTIQQTILSIPSLAVKPHSATRHTPPCATLRHAPHIAKPNTPQIPYNFNIATNMLILIKFGRLSEYYTTTVYI